MRWFRRKREDGAAGTITCDDSIDLEVTARELGEREAAGVACEERIALREERTAEREWKLAERERALIDSSPSNGAWASSNSLTLVNSRNEKSSQEVERKANPGNVQRISHSTQHLLDTGEVKGKSLHIIPRMQQVEGGQYIPRLQHTRRYSMKQVRREFGGTQCFFWTVGLLI